MTSTEATWHGTWNGYSYHRCRCADCRRANTEAAYRRRKKREAAAVPAGAVHGRRYTYVGYGCRCRPCTDAQTAYCTEYKRRRRNSAGQS